MPLSLAHKNENHFLVFLWAFEHVIELFQGSFPIFWFSESILQGSFVELKIFGFTNLGVLRAWSLDIKIGFFNGPIR